ncbi:hypothetical protein [Kitasatospora sp. NPDC093558]|uniref:hypothetical protein n=1 Tax=Kitasatospora sp. NPDC093558 TaxID=3155201 RepID=UPI003420AE1B
MTPPDPPDVEAMANASSTRSAGREAAERMNGQIAQLRAKAPWAEQLGTSVLDRCESELRVAVAFASGSWELASCERTTSVYVAFDGDLRERLAELDGSIDAQGWKSRAEPRSAGLVAADRYLHQPPVGAKPEESASAEARPTLVWVEYALPGEGPTSTELSVGVTQAPAMPPGEDDRPNQYDDHGRRPYANDDTHREVVFTVEPLRAKELVQKTAHKYVALFKFHTRYFVEPSREGAAAPH